MKRTDLSIIMRTAWQMCRATGVTFAECLHKAWQVFKLKIKMRAGIVQFFYSNRVRVNCDRHSVRLRTTYAPKQKVTTVSLTNTS